MKINKLVLISAITMVFVLILSACQTTTQEEGLPTADPNTSQTSAGKDLTDEIKEVSPHSVKTLEGIPVLGKLVTN